MFVTNWISPTKIQKISEITNFFRHYFLSRTEVYLFHYCMINGGYSQYGFSDSGSGGLNVMQPSMIWLAYF